MLRYDVDTQSFLSPVVLGSHLNGMDISPDGKTLAVADATYNKHEVWLYLVNLQSLKARKITFQTDDDGEDGTFTVAYGRDGKLLFTESFAGSGSVPLRRYDPASRQKDVIGTVNQDSMLTASAKRRVLALAESNASNGPFGKYDVETGQLDQRGETEEYNYEIGVSKDAQIFAIPTFSGTFIADADLHMTGTIIGENGSEPVSAVFDPKKSLAYFPWMGSSEVKVYDTRTWSQVRSFDFENNFLWHGYAFAQGRAKMSKDGALLFVTVDGGVRFVQTRQKP